MSLVSRSCCTCGASSEPNVEVAIRHPPPFVGLESSESILNEFTVSSKSCKSLSKFSSELTYLIWKNFQGVYIINSLNFTFTITVLD